MDKAKRKLKNEADSTQEDLMWAIGFTPTDLETNQEGVLSDHQRRKFQSERRTSVLNAAALGVLIIAVFVLMHKWDSMTGIVLLLPIFGCGWLALVSITRALDCHNDIKHNQADSVQGRVSLDISDKGYYMIQLQQKVWPVKKTIFLAFKNGDPYAIYFAPRTNKILSAEWLRVG